MTFTSESLRSHGPDRWHGPNCLGHHEFTRTGWPDFLCCCNPCLYDDGMPPPGVPDVIRRDKTCCRCMPRIIFCNFTPQDTDGLCCRVLGVPLFLSKTYDLDTESTYGSYSTTLWDVDIELRVGMGHSASSEYGSGEYGLSRPCLWRLIVKSRPGAAAEIDIDEEVAIDHIDVTCLSVPGFTITNFPGFGGDCLGTITFADFDRAKVPFVKRTFDEEPSHLVELDEDCEVCHWACREIWVRGKKRLGDIDWNFSKFTWDDSFTPEEFIKGVWNGPTVDGYQEQIKLVINQDEYSDDYGKCQLQFFLEDASGDYEYFEPITIDTTRKAGCALSEETGFIDPYGDNLHLTISCAFCKHICMKGKRHLTGNQLGYDARLEFTWSDDYAADLTDPYTDHIIGIWTYTPLSGRTEWFGLYQDPDTGELSIHWRLESDDGTSEHFSPSAIVHDTCECLITASAETEEIGPDDETLSITLRCGRCACWTYLCESCRCAPRNLCLNGMIHGVWIPPEIAVWDEDSLSWISDHVTLTLYNDSETQTCKLLITYFDDYGEPAVEFDPIAAVDLCSAICTLYGYKDEGTGGLAAYSFISATAYNGVGCPQVPCGLCWEECGGNPTTLTATFHRSDSQENSGYEVDPECDFEVTLHWFQFITQYLVVSCGWIGYIEGSHGEVYTVVLTESGLSTALGIAIPPIYDFVDSGVNNGDLRIAIADFDTVECGPVYLHATKLASDEFVPPIDPCDRPYYPDFIGLADIEVTITE